MFKELIVVLASFQLLISGCGSHQLSTEELMIIRSVSLDTLLKDDVDLTRSHQKPVIDLFIKDSIDITDLKDRFFRPGHFDTIPGFCRNEYAEIIERQNLIVNIEVENNKRVSSGYFKINYTTVGLEDYPGVDTLCFVIIAPVMVNEKADHVIQIIQYHKAVDWGVAFAYYFRKINSKWVLEGRRRLWIS